ncbi:MAG: DNA polymerase III subunit gamma/tau, partial [Bryobacteraceae bacterium]
DAAEVRALLGGFSLDSLQQVSQALTGSQPAAMLGIVDELERNGHNLQHFAREVARYFRNLLVAKVADVRLIPASAAERERLTDTARGFSEEDLTRYLQLSLDLFRDLQSSLQPRFHLELGLIRMVQAGKLIAIEEALAMLGTAETPKAAMRPVTEMRLSDSGQANRPAHIPPSPPPPAAPKGPSPFELDRMKKAGRSEPQMSDGTSALAPAPVPDAVPGSGMEWKSALHAKLVELGLMFTADGVEQSVVTEVSGELQFVTPKDFMMGMKADDINKAVRLITARVMRIKVTVGKEEATAPAPVQEKRPAAKDDEVSQRAMANPEVQSFQQLFGGQVRTVRNLKE